MHCDLVILTQQPFMWLQNIAALRMAVSGTQDDGVVLNGMANIVSAARSLPPGFCTSSTGHCSVVPLCVHTPCITSADKCTVHHLHVRDHAAGFCVPVFHSYWGICHAAADPLARAIPGGRQHHDLHHHPAYADAGQSLLISCC